MVNSITVEKLNSSQRPFDIGSNAYGSNAPEPDVKGTLRGIEEWQWVKGYEGIYKISNLGRGKSYKTGRGTVSKLIKKDGGRFLVPVACGRVGSKYFRFKFLKDKKVKCCNIHQLVAKHFVSNPNNFKEVNHIDGNKLNNHFKNLEWCTRSHNMKHCFAMHLGIHSGERNPKSKLTEKQVRQIRKLRGGNLTRKQIAKKFNISIGNLGNIMSGHTWENI